MKKDQLTCTKGTTRRAIHKTFPYPPIPNMPVIKNLREAFDYIFLLHKTNVFLQGDTKHWKTMFELSKSMETVMDNTLKLKDATIEALRMGDIPADTYVEMKNEIEELKSVIRDRERKIDQLKSALKKSNRFHYQDFILN